MVFGLGVAVMPKNAF